MKLYKFFKDGEKVVYGGAMDGKCLFFFDGFESVEEAKSATFEALYNYKLSKLTPNQQGITRPHSMIKAEVEMSLIGQWSKID